MPYRQVHRDAQGRVVKVTWVAEVEVEGHRFRKRGLDSRSAAEKQERMWRRGEGEDVEEALSKPETGPTLLKVAKRYSNRLWPQYSWRRLMEYALHRIAKQLDPVNGDPALDEITKGSLREVADYLEATGLSPVTVRKYFCAISGVLKAAEEEGLIKAVPTIPWPKGNKVKKRWLSVDEEERMLDLLRRWGWNSPQASIMADFIEISIATAMRRKELLTLTPEQLDYPWVRLWSTKTGQPRAVPVPDREVFDLLKKRVPWTLTPQAIRYWWAKVKKEMRLTGDKELTPHVTRHTAATRVYEDTGDLKLVQGLLGHSRLSTTADVYSHLGDPKLLDAASLLVSKMSRSRRRKKTKPDSRSGAEKQGEGDGGHSGGN